MKKKKNKKVKISDIDKLSNVNLNYEHGNDDKFLNLSLKGVLGVYRCDYMGCKKEKKP